MTQVAGIPLPEGANVAPARIRVRRGAGSGGRMGFVVFVMLLLYGPLILLAMSVRSV